MRHAHFLPCRTHVNATLPVSQWAHEIKPLPPSLHTRHTRAPVPVNETWLREYAQPTRDLIFQVFDVLLTMIRLGVMGDFERIRIVCVDAKFHDANLIINTIQIYSIFSI
jgi:hypothetical protein